MITKLLALIPAKALLKKLPEILAFIFSKGFQYLAKKHPQKLDKLLETLEEIQSAAWKHLPNSTFRS